MTDAAAKNAAQNRAWEVIASEERLNISPWLKVRTETVRLPDGRVADNYVQLEQPSFVCIYPELPDGRVICLRHYRHGPRRECVVFPGGHLDSPDEAPIHCAMRELKEETGYVAAAWIYLGAFVVNANAGGAWAHMFRATGCRKVAEPDSGDLEDSCIELLSPPEIIAAAGRGEMPLTTQIALLGMAINPVLSSALARGGR